MTEPRIQRLFVALCPDAAVRASLVNIQVRMNLARFGLVTPAEKLHMTLIFLGEVPETEMVEIERFVEWFDFVPFSLSISQVGFWSHNRIVWAGPTTVSAELSELSKRIQVGLGKCDSNSRKFVPHITLARKMQRRMVCEITPIEWTVRNLHLVRSTLTNAGAHYEWLTFSKI